MKLKIISFVIILLSVQMVAAQSAQPIKLTLRECVKQAAQRNVNVRAAVFDKQIGKEKQNEARATLYPKITGSFNFTDNIKLPTTLMDMSAITGVPTPPKALSLGSKYSATGIVNISQVLFNETAFTALEVAKQYDQLNDLGIRKSEEEIATQVAKMYALALTTAEQQKIIETNIDRAEQIKRITSVTVNAGVGKQIDMDRVNVNLENMYTQLSNTKASYEQQMNTIKYIINVPLDATIVLTDSIGVDLLASQPVLLNDFSSNVNVQLLETQNKMNKLNVKFINAGYFPSLSLSGQVAKQGQQSTTFGNYFKGGDANQWFPYYNFTVALSVPIFDGFEKRSKARQAKMTAQKTELTINNTKESLNLDYRNALNTYTNNKTNVSRQKQNLELAEKVYKETSLKYKEGMATMSSLLQDETGLNNAQAGYLTALYNLKDSELKIMSLNGEINRLIQK